MLRQRDQPVLEAHGEVQAGEACPLAIRSQQLRGLVALHPPATKSRHQLDQREIADEPSLVAAQPLQADDSGGPGAEASLSLDEVRCLCGRQRMQALEVDRAADAYERRCAPRVEPELAQPRR